MELILDSNRNALLALDLKVSIVTMGLGAGALGVGAFGMNVGRILRNYRLCPQPQYSFKTTGKMMVWHSLLSQEPSSGSLCWSSSWVCERRQCHLFGIQDPQLIVFKVVQNSQGWTGICPN